MDLRKHLKPNRGHFMPELRLSSNIAASAFSAAATLLLVSLLPGSLAVAQESKPAPEYKFCSGQSARRRITEKDDA
jgi:hypothetical protein